MPQEWSRVIMVLLPKVVVIFVCSVSVRLFPNFSLGSCCKYQGHAQTMGESRQPTGYVWLVSRVLQLEWEWKAGLWIAQVDVQKAFDTLNREAFLRRLKDRAAQHLDRTVRQHFGVPSDSVGPKCAECGTRDSSEVLRVVWLSRL